MKKKNLPALGFALVLLLVLVIAAAIDYRALNSTQFTTSGTVSIKNGAVVTNTTEYLSGDITFLSDGDTGFRIGSYDATSNLTFKAETFNVETPDGALFRVGVQSQNTGLKQVADQLQVFAGSVLMASFDSGNNRIYLPKIPVANGSELTNLNASSLASGTVPDLRLLGASPTFNVVTATNGIVSSGPGVGTLRLDDLDASFSATIKAASVTESNITFILPNYAATGLLYATNFNGTNTISAVTIGSGLSFNGTTLSATAQSGGIATNAFSVNFGSTALTSRYVGYGGGGNTAGAAASIGNGNRIPVAIAVFEAYLDVVTAPLSTTNALALVCTNGVDDTSTQITLAGNGSQKATNITFSPKLYPAGTLICIKVGASTSYNPAGIAASFSWYPQ